MKISQKIELDQYCKIYNCKLIHHGSGHFAIIGDKQRVDYWPGSKMRSCYAYKDNERYRYVGIKDAVLLSTHSERNRATRKSKRYTNASNHNPSHES